MTTYEDLLASLPEDRRSRVEAKAKQLIREEKVRRSTATRRVALKPLGVRKLGIAARLERLESRKDISVGALRREVAAMRGKLRLVVEIEGQPPVELKRLGSGAWAAE